MLSPWYREFELGREAEKKAAERARMGEIKG